MIGYESLMLSVWVFHLKGVSSDGPGMLTGCFWMLI